MTQTTIRRLERRGWSDHAAKMIYTEDLEGVGYLSIYSNDGLDIWIPAEDVLEALGPAVSDLIYRAFENTLSVGELKKYEKR